MLDFLITAGLLVVILGSSKLLTDAYVKRAYYQCRQCGSLNAKRRSACRNCGGGLPTPADSVPARTERRGEPPADPRDAAGTRPPS